MATPSNFLPLPTPEDAINNLMAALGLPKPLAITSPKSTAAYHSIYMLKMPDQDLVLRVAGQHLPRIKTENEAATMSWVAINTNIPIPKVVAFDSSAQNPIKNEYSLLYHAPGETLCNIYSELSETHLVGLIDQLIDFLVQLHEAEWDSIGGLVFDGTNIVTGPVLEETFWHSGDIQELWPGETVESLNIAGPYPTYVDYISAHIQTYMYAIEKHEKLAFMRDTLPRLEKFLEALSKNSKKLNDVKLRLAHKDLHLANILYDRQSNKITSILDWEFSGVVPFTRWDPVKAFLWNVRYDDHTMAEKARLMDIFKTRCEERNVDILKDAEFSSPLQESMQKATNFLRAIVDLAPREKRPDDVKQWRENMLEQISLFGALTRVC